MHLWVEFGKPYQLDKQSARFILEIDEQRLTYRHGPKLWADLNWSGKDKNKRVRIVFEDLEKKRHEKTFDGPWAWFRLIEQSKLIKTNKSNIYQVTFNVTEQSGKGEPYNHNIKYLIKAKSGNNPFSQYFLGSFKIPEKL